MEHQILSKEAFNILVLNMMAKHSEKCGKDILELYGIASSTNIADIQVNVVINGVPIEADFTEILKEATNKLMDDYSEHVDKQAKQILSDNVGYMIEKLSFIQRDIDYIEFNT